MTQALASVGRLSSPRVGPDLSLLRAILMHDSRNFNRGGAAGTRHMDQHLEDLRQPALALLRAHVMHDSPHTSPLQRMKALGCFRSSSMAQQYCDAIREIAKNDKDVAHIFAQQAS